jgi:hypothetical protein
MVFTAKLLITSVLALKYEYELICHEKKNKFCKEVGPGRVKIGPLKWAKLN